MSEERQIRIENKLDDVAEAVFAIKGALRQYHEELYGNANENKIGVVTKIDRTNTRITKYMLWMLGILSSSGILGSGGVALAKTGGDPQQAVKLIGTVLGVQ